MDEQPKNPLEKAAAEQPQPSLLSDFWYFLRYHKRWWLVPLLLILLLFGALMLLSGSAVAPFIYTFF
jgi:hypothetical protein